MSMPIALFRAGRAAVVDPVTARERSVRRRVGLTWGLLFLNNNLHSVHHLYPKMPWWEIPGFWRANRDKVLAHNDNNYYRGYGEIAAQWLLKPIFLPPHPRENFR